MKKDIRSLAMILPLSLFMFTSCDLSSQLNGSDPTTPGLTETDIASGLKEALVFGCKTAAFTLSDTSGTTNSLNEITGYLANEAIRINLPVDAEKAIETINLLNNSTTVKVLFDAAGIDISQYREAMIHGLNRGAEAAAALSVDVFKKAILEMDIISAQGILNGQDSTAATHYLQNTTTSILTSGFSPIVDSAFSAVMVTAFGKQLTVKDLWSDFTTDYNKVVTAYQTLKKNETSINPVTAATATAILGAISDAGVPSIDPLDTDIVNFATGKALDGLFVMVGKQEVKIRRDPVAALASAINFATNLAYDLITKVFKKTTT